MRWNVVFRQELAYLSTVCEDVRRVVSAFKEFGLPAAADRRDYRR
jgi:hypothetical protein